MKEQIEQELGFEISEDQFQSSKERANEKLRAIITHYGDAGGARQDPEYLAELILEDVIAVMLSETTILVAVEMLNMEKEHPVKYQSAPHD